MWQITDPIIAGLLEAAPDATVCVDSGGQIVLVNAQAERLFGYPREELTGQPVEILVPDASKARHRALRARYAANPRHRPIGALLDLSGRRHDGTTFPAEIALSALDTGQGLLVTAAIRDVTQQRQADAWFRGLLEAAPDATVCVDQDGRIVLVNAQAERLFGYPREELAGQPVEILVPDASKARHRALRARYAANPRHRPIGALLDLSGRRRDGTTFPAEIALSALDTGQGLLVSAAIRDVTRQRQALDDLQRTTRNLESLTYSIAHDLRTPLRSLAGFSAALMEEYADVLGETGRDYTARIEAASEHIGDVLDSLVRLSRVSRAEISFQPVDLGAEAARIAGELQRQDPGRHVTFTIQQPAQALADPGLIRTVLHNLLENAWKFTTGRDDATIEFGMTPAKGARVSCYVRDNGAGFDPAFAHKLFQPFQRLHTTQEFPGTGIGLASVRQIVDRHNGRTWAEGTVGEGATFFFTLQAAEPAAQPDEYRPGQIDS